MAISLDELQVALCSHPSSALSFCVYVPLPLILRPRESDLVVDWSLVWPRQPSVLISLVVSLFRQFILHHFCASWRPLNLCVFGFSKPSTELYYELLNFIFDTIQCGNCNTVVEINWTILQRSVFMNKNSTVTTSLLFYLFKRLLFSCCFPTVLLTITFQHPLNFILN